MMEHHQLLKLRDANNNLTLKNILDFDEISSTIFIEKQFTPEVPDFVRAAAMLVALHYVFNVSAKMISFCPFLQNIGLEINGKLKRPKKILNLISKLKRDNFMLALLIKEASKFHNLSKTKVRFN